MTEKHILKLYVTDRTVNIPKIAQLNCGDVLIRNGIFLLLDIKDRVAR